MECSSRTSAHARGLEMLRRGRPVSLPDESAQRCNLYEASRPLSWRAGLRISRLPSFVVLICKRTVGDV
jgi:hypothetical protein